MFSDIIVFCSHFRLSLCIRSVKQAWIAFSTCERLIYGDTGVVLVPRKEVAR
jgi:hypothetical protein